MRNRERVGGQLEMESEINGLHERLYKCMYK